MTFIHRILIFIFLLIALPARSPAAIEIPSGLNSEDRQEVIRLLGLGTSSKVISNPYPLGGYSGFEFGLTVESVPIEDLGRLGLKSASEKTFTYPKFSVGKGLYKDIDVFLHFVPYNQNMNFSDYGGIVRWCFYQAAFLPATFSILLHGNNSNIANLVFSQSSGAELVTGINVGTFSLYVGGGRIYTSGRFVPSLNLTSATESETVSSFHSFIGFDVDWDPLFMAFQIDQYNQTVMSGKLGFRF